MASHLFEATTPKASVARWLIVYYQQAHRAGIPHTKAMRYATAQCERDRQGSPNIPDPNLATAKRYAWWHGCNSDKGTKHASEATFKRLLVAFCGGMPKLLGSRPDELLAQAIAKHKPQVVAQVKLAAANYVAVVGELPKGAGWGVYRRDILTAWLLGETPCKPWLRVSTARQLFVKGWGKFAMPATSGEYVTPTDLTQHGYGFASREQLLLAKSKPWRAWFTRHWAWWRQGENLARIDELGDRRGEYAVAQAYLREHPQVTPQALLQHMATTRQRIEQQFNARYGVRNVAYQWLADVPAQQVGELKIEPVRTSSDLVRVGNALHNCAANYDYQVAERDCMLVAVTDSTGKPVALGELLPSGKWGQVLGPCNTQLPQATRELFSNYTPIAMGAKWVGSVPALPAP